MQSSHGHVLPREISIYENGRHAVQVHVEDLQEARDVDPNAFQPTAEMVDAGGSFTLAPRSRFPMRVDPSDAPTSTIFQPVIVHAILDAQDGRVLDAEALQNSDQGLSQAAIDLVRTTNISAVRISAGSFYQRAVSSARNGSGWSICMHTRFAWVI
jgi:hypothetical protein